MLTSFKSIPWDIDRCHVLVAEAQARAEALAIRRAYEISPITLP
jgi:hypothetical protein